MEFLRGPGPGIGEDLTIFHHPQSGQMGMSENDDIKPSGKKLPSGGAKFRGLFQFSGGATLKTTRDLRLTIRADEAEPCKGET